MKKRTLNEELKRILEAVSVVQSEALNNNM